ncbi:unnamed protein product [Miscanthus lutarioriparius]|uniref:Disease resistance protein At4g27190-like leucine-rich repeats domain-containing protein n=1 Tax=Miscanthus lutarioriparius TaxID=422564 RepID=A0A811R8F5_9POAL|nr:unnamed protein product [Miscanthus lutarioriparius]
MFQRIDARDVVAAREEILNLIQGNLKNNIIYFDGWRGFGATAVLRSIAQAIPSMKSPPPKLCFGRTIYIDCSRWESKRVMQRKIAEELKLDRKTIAMFAKQDEEDDFNGVDHGSRDVIRQVSEIIAQTLRESRFMMIFINGSADEVSLTEFGIVEYDGMVIWTFGRRFVTMHEYHGTHSIERLAENLRHIGLFIWTTYLSISQLNALFREEAANIAARYPFLRDIDLTMVIDCCCYGFFLRRKSHNTIGLEWAAHAPNFWMCDGIIQKGDKTREIVNTLDSEINFNGDDSLLGKVFAKMTEHSDSSHLLVEDHGSVHKYKKRAYRWISVTSKNKILKDNLQTILATASSIFVSFDKTVNAPRLPNTLFKQCNKLGVLVLSCCAFSFVSPPFLHCNTLRFLGLGNCTHQNNNTSEPEGRDCITKWTFLQSLWVLDLRYTDWGEILSEEKIGLMANITELNIEGARCWQCTGQLLEKMLPYLQRLRIIKPTHQEETTSLDINNSFVGKKQLEILDLSGNSDMKSLPTSLSEASKLQVLVLDGCDGLENVVLHNSLLRSFSFDGYGPASHWTSTGKLPPMSSRPKGPSAVDNKKDVRACKISLEGCTLLEDLFLRGLPNLEELDLSGCAIKVLDFGAMVVDVPRLKRLFLLGCENLRAIKWGSDEQRPKLLELICIDTRPRVGCARPLSLCAQQKSFQLQVHAIFADAMLARSLLAPLYSARSEDAHCYFNISITSSATCMETIQPEATTDKEKVTGSIDDQRHYDIAARDMYCDIFTKVGNSPTPMQAFPQGPAGQLDRHIEIGDGSRSVQSEVEADPFGDNLAKLMRKYTESLHVHDVSTWSNTMPMPTGYWESLRWCRVERCPSLHAVFPPDTEDLNGTLETIWVSDLLMARCVWSKAVIHYYSVDRFRSLRHLHLRCCPSLRFGLAMGKRPSFPSLQTLHIVHCGELRHVFVPGDADEKHRHTSVEFPKLTTIHLHDLPALQQICEAAEMLAPALETIRIRGCWSLRRLPAFNEPGKRRPTVEIEKDVWDALEWDGVDARHHPSLYEAPVHSRYYKRRMLRTTVLR